MCGVTGTIAVLTAAALGREAPWLHQGLTLLPQSQKGRSVCIVHLLTVTLEVTFIS